MSRHRMFRVTGGLLAVFALLVTGCSGDDKPAAVTTPTYPGVPKLPTGAATPGARFGPHEQANVVFAPTPKRSGYLRIRIGRVVTGSISDLLSYHLTASTRRSTPYYVHVTLTGLDRGDIGGAPVPLLVVSAHNILLQAAEVIGTFPRCQTERIPDRFGKGSRFDTCLLYFSPKHGKLTGVEFQYDPRAAPVVWSVNPQPR
jgi:hypothetical protein